jgi:hypothetical protein
LEISEFFSKTFWNFLTKFGWLVVVGLVLPGWFGLAGLVFLANPTRPGG